MSRLAQTVLALAAIFAAAGSDLNAGDFISRGVGGIDERDEKSTGYCHHEMEMPCIGEGHYTDKLTGWLGNNTC
jgi:hypothetical protein